MEHSYYTEKKHVQKLDFGTISINIFQPTASGVMILCDHYRKKYNIDLQCIDLINKINNAENVHDFFSYLNEHPDLITVCTGQSRGLILMHGTNHAIPVLIHQGDEVRHMVVFDSSSGSRTRGYFAEAKLFNDAQTLFYLNSGTRQSDGESCITDAICILKEALLIDNLITLIENKVTNDHPSLFPYQGSPGYQPLQLTSSTKPDHFRLFHMPEELLLTAQRPAYVEEANADLSVILRGGKSLGDFRDHYKATFNLTRDDKVDGSESINSFLFLKGAEYKEFLDYSYKINTGSLGCERSSTIESPDQSEIEQQASVFKNRSGFFYISKITTNSPLRDTVLASPIPRTIEQG